MGFKLGQQRDLYPTERDMGALTNIPWEVKEIFAYAAGKLAGAHTQVSLQMSSHRAFAVPDFEPHLDFMMVCELFTLEYIAC